MIHYHRTHHARLTIADRGIDLAWIERVLENPLRTERDRTDSDLGLSVAYQNMAAVFCVSYTTTRNAAADCDGLFRQVHEGRVMRMRYDEQADALYLRLDESKIIDSQEVQPGIILDFNESNQVVGIEILRLKERAPSANLKQLLFEVA